MTRSSFKLICWSCWCGGGGVNLKILASRPSVIGDLAGLRIDLAEAVYLKVYLVKSSTNNKTGKMGNLQYICTSDCS